MSLLSKLFKSIRKNSVTDVPPEDFTFLVRLAEIISHNDENVVSAVAECVGNVNLYAEKNKSRYYAEWAVDIKECDMETLCLTGFISELEYGGYLAVADSSCCLDDFLFAVNQLKTLETDLSDIELSEEEAIQVWCEAVNIHLKGKPILCGVDIGGEDWNLIWLTKEELDEVFELCKGKRLYISYADCCYV